jgi:hypothetical protein
MKHKMLGWSLLLDGTHKTGETTSIHFKVYCVEHRTLWFVEAGTHTVALLTRWQGRVQYQHQGSGPLVHKRRTQSSRQVQIVTISVQSHDKDHLVPRVVLVLFQ